MAKGDVTAPHHHTTIKELIHCIVLLCVYTRIFYTIFFNPNRINIYWLSVFNEFYKVSIFQKLNQTILI